MLTGISWPVMIFLRRLSGFFGRIKDADSLDFASVLLYFTSLWASVATKVISSGDNSQKTPDNTSLSSSFPVAKRVLLMAWESREEVSSMEVVLSRPGTRGYSSLLWPASLYLPSPAEISIPWLSSLIVNETGISANVFNVSTRIFAGMAILPFWSALSGFNVTLMVVSRSEEVIVSASSFRSNRKSSRIGKVLLVLITPIMDCRFLSKRELETMNFITASFLFYI